MCKQKRYLEIDDCVLCNYFDEGGSMYPSRANYMICTKSERLIPKENKFEKTFAYGIDIPQWCPLTTIE